MHERDPNGLMRMKFDESHLFAVEAKVKPC